MPAPEFDASLHQTIGSLNAKADQSQKDTASLRGELAATNRALAELPDTVKAIVERALAPVDSRLTRVESNLSDVQQTVIRWKTVLALLTTLAGAAGYGLSQWLSLKKLFGVG